MVTTTTEMALRIMLMLVANLHVVLMVSVASWPKARLGMTRAMSTARYRNMPRRARLERSRLSVTIWFGAMSSFLEVGGVRRGCRAWATNLKETRHGTEPDRHR